MSGDMLAESLTKAADLRPDDPAAAQAEMIRFWLKSTIDGCRQEWAPILRGAESHYRHGLMDALDLIEEVLTGEVPS